MAGQSPGSNIENWSLGKTEIAYNLEKTASVRGDTEAAEWQLYVPKIMPLIEKALPKEVTAPLTPKSIFINTQDCMPVVQASIKTRNYIKASRPANCSFTYRHKFHDMELEVEVLHDNPDNLRITNTIDNSIFN